MNEQLAFKGKWRFALYLPFIIQNSYLNRTNFDKSYTPQCLLIKYKIFRCLVFTALQKTSYCKRGVSLSLSPPTHPPIPARIRLCQCESNLHVTHRSEVWALLSKISPVSPSTLHLRTFQIFSTVSSSFVYTVQRWMSCGEHFLCEIEWNSRPKPI